MNQDFLLFVKQFDQEMDMKLYNIKHKLEMNSKFENKISKDNNKTNLAKYVYDNYDNMDEFEMKMIVLKCLDMNHIRSLLLNFELEHYEEKSFNSLSLEQFEEKALKILKRYHWKAGGFLLEDVEWMVHKSNSQKYDIKKNELLFENTVDVSDMNDDMTIRYLNSLQKRLKSLSKNIEIELKQKNHSGKSKTIYLLIWATDKTAQNIVEIGL
jgi:hypothetical protein